MCLQLRLVLDVVIVYAPDSFLYLQLRPSLTSVCRSLHCEKDMHFNLDSITIMALELLRRAREDRFQHTKSWLALFCCFISQIIDLYIPEGSVAAQRAVGAILTNYQTQAEV